DQAADAPADTAHDTPTDAHPDVSADAPSDGPSTTTDAHADAPPAVENCTNGVDDNGNGLVDCADPACQPGYECLPAPAAGWTVARVDTGASNSAAPPCPTGYGSPSTLGSGFAVPSPGCTTCSCDSPTNGTCGTMTPRLYGNGGCAVGLIASLGTASGS